MGAFLFLSFPGISSWIPLPRASFSLGSLSWNLPSEAVEAFATTAAVASYNKYCITKVLLICDQYGHVTTYLIFNNYIYKSVFFVI